QEGGRTTTVLRAPLVPASRVRPVVESVRPQVDGGRRPAKASVGDSVVVEADAFADGHDVVSCELRFRHDGDQQWSTVPMEAVGNDRWRAAFAVDSMGRYRFLVGAPGNHFMTLRIGLRGAGGGG